MQKRWKILKKSGGSSIMSNRKNKLQAIMILMSAFMFFGLTGSEFVPEEFRFNYIFALCLAIGASLSSISTVKGQDDDNAAAKSPMLTFTKFIFICAFIVYFLISVSE